MEEKKDQCKHITEDGKCKFAPYCRPELKTEEDFCKEKDCFVTNFYGDKKGNR